MAHLTDLEELLAQIPGSEIREYMREAIYVVSGHYDSINSHYSTANGGYVDAEGLAPGADDDASGTAAVIEMACVMARYQFDATLVFMAVAGEEQGLFGSTHFAEEAKQKNLDIAGMFTNDIIGSSRDADGRIDNSRVRLFAQGIPSLKEMPDNLRTLISTGGENDTPSRQLARYVKEIGERYVSRFAVSIVQREDRYLRGGDHLPFLDRGYPALRFTEPNEDYKHQHQDVRVEGGVQFGDLPQFVDFDYTAQVARVNAASLASLALAPAAPRDVRMKTAKLENDSTLVWQANLEPDLAGYRIVWRDTTASAWQAGIFVGKVTQYTVKGMSKDNYFFGVQAIDQDGNASVATYPTPLR
jgi:Zn-dependent M28 family amino/carboxypeptidase